MSDRAARATAFLALAGWGAAERHFLAGDASARRYDRLRRGSDVAVLMDAPPDQGEDTPSFVRIARHLRHLGLSAPTILAEDHVMGFLLIEDLGDSIFARVVKSAPASEPALYAVAVDALIQLQANPPAAALDDLPAAGWATGAAVALEWYAFAITGDRHDAGPLIDALDAALRARADGPRVMILRDYHAENLVWLPDRHGPARAGLLDFQLAQMGQPGYDLVSLCQDARRDVGAETERAMIARFLDATGTDANAFAASYAVLGALRALRILGVFARLSLVAGKPDYVSLIPRVWGHLQRNFAHPSLAGVTQVCNAVLPKPTAVALQRIRRQCGAP